MECVELKENENKSIIINSTTNTFERKKKQNRRSSAGSELLASCGCDESIDQLIIPEEKVQRPRRIAAVKAQHDFKQIIQKRKKEREIRYSLEIGERVDLKSCMKSSQEKSIAQTAAKKVLKKYQTLSTSTPSKIAKNNLRFNSICTIQVITPRSEYDPENLCLPSDDEDTKNPERERLSTVNLEITPQSIAYLNSIKDKDGEKVQFRAHMIFGDGETDSDPTSTCNEKTESSSSKSLKQRKKRKSLIVGAASPLSTPPTALNEIKTKEQTDSEIKLDNRRRSTRFIPLSSESDDSKIVFDTSSQKKNESDTKTKRIRRKSRFITETVKTVDFSTAAFNKNTVETKKKMINSDFFSPRLKKEDKNLKDEIIIIENTSEEDSNKLKRRSTVLLFDRTNEQTQSEKTLSQNTPNNVLNPSTSKSTSSTSNSSTPKKFFSMFSPRSFVPKTEKSSCSNVDSNPKCIATSVTDSTISNKNLIKEIRVEKKWGDRLAPTYSFIDFNVKQSLLENDNNIEQINFPTRQYFEYEVKKASSDYIFKLRENVSEINDEKFVIGPIEKVKNGKEMCMDNSFGLENEGLRLKEKGPNEYKPTNVEHLMGHEEINQVKKWLQMWKKKVRKEAKELEKLEKNKKEKKKIMRKKRTLSSSDEDEYTNSDNDEDYEESNEEDLENPMVLIGPIGVGKTAMIEAIANEENMKIVSMGPDEERKGSSIKSKLTEAMRSHRMNSERSAGMVRFFQNKPCFYQRKEDTASMQKSKSILDKKFSQSLVVIEHVDLFFGKYDKNASSALIEMINTAKVPVVWTCEREYPKKTIGGVMLETKPIEIHLKRNKSVIRKYCQQLIYHATDVWINEEKIKELALSCHYDLRGLIRQTYFFALKPEMPLPLMPRSTVSQGFDYDWVSEKKDLENFENRASSMKWEKMERDIEKCELIKNYISEKVEQNNDSRFDKISLDDVSSCLKKQKKNMINVNYGYEAFFGRFSKNAILTDILPYLSLIDDSEKQKNKGKKRRLHRFTEAVSSEYPIDDAKLMNCLAQIRSLY